MISGDMVFIIGTVSLFIMDRLVSKVRGQAIPGRVYWPIQGLIFALAVVIALNHGINSAL